MYGIVHPGGIPSGQFRTILFLSLLKIEVLFLQYEVIKRIFNHLKVRNHRKSTDTQSIVNVQDL